MPDIPLGMIAGGRFKLIAFIIDPAEARRYLDHEGLPPAVPMIAPARAPPQREFAYVDDVPF
jgi:hypothetical protein